MGVFFSAVNPEADHSERATPFMTRYSHGVALIHLRRQAAAAQGWPTLRSKNHPPIIF